MTTENRSPWVDLDGHSDRQIEILREELNDWLVAKANDLPKQDDDRVKREVEEVASKLLARELAHGVDPEGSPTWRDSIPSPRSP